MTNSLEQKLQTIHNGNKPNPVFAEQLEQELRRIHTSTTSVHLGHSRRIGIVRRMIAIAASVLIVFGLFATVSPLRSFAQSLLEQLFPTTGEDKITIIYNDLGTPQEFPTIDTLREVVPYTLIAPRELPAGPVEATYIYYPSRNVATQQYVTTSLDIWVSQQPIIDAQSKGLLALGFDLALPDDIETRPLQIGEAQAELIRGMWVETGEVDANGSMLYRWTTNFWYFSLRWQDEEYIYEVAAMPSSVRTLEEVETAVIDVARSMVAD